MKRIWGRRFHYNTDRRLEKMQSRGRDVSGARHVRVAFFAGPWYNGEPKGGRTHAQCDSDRHARMRQEHGGRAGGQGPDDGFCGYGPAASAKGRAAPAADGGRAGRGGLRARGGGVRVRAGGARHGDRHGRIGGHGGRGHGAPEGRRAGDFPQAAAGDALAPPQEHENARHRHGEGADAARPLRAPSASLSEMGGRGGGRRGAGRGGPQILTDLHPHHQVGHGVAGPDLPVPYADLLAAKIQEDI